MTATTNGVTANLQKFRNLLRELFQLDQADLDFGIYRIMNQKRDDILRFLDNDLLPQVQEAFGQYKSSDKAELQAQLDEAIRQATSLGVDPEQTGKVKELRQRIAESSVDIAALESEVFSHLYNFFNRYYSEGDFISLRRYKEGVYAIPYEGEEVKLHWANADQYYIKSTEYFRDYIFTVQSGKRVRVHIVAASTEQDNNKAATGKERRFVLCDDNPLVEEDGELFIRFEYRPLGDGDTAAPEEESETSSKRKKVPKQAEFTAAAIETILKAPGFDTWVQTLGQLAPSDNNPKRTVLEKHLTKYTARNTFDYFIHKDLGGFLRRELDFYIKNEVIHLDDVENETTPKVEQYLSKIKVIRRIAHKIITFLAQLEDFQKKLWLKKKFVVETNYCITLDRIPEELYPEIAANDAQRKEWVQLLVIDEIEEDLHSPGYSVPLGVGFLKAHKSLVLDTCHFELTFRHKLLATLDDLDGYVDGLLVAGDNFHALGLLQARYADQIKCVYIDPPYNTGVDDFIYKDGYQHSSWMSLLEPRIHSSLPLLSPEGTLLVSCDDHEEHRLRQMLDQTFSSPRFMANLVWKSRQNVDSRATDNISNDHEFVLAYGTSLRGGLKDLNKYSNPDTDPRGDWMSDNMVGLANRAARPNLHFNILVGGAESVRTNSGGSSFSVSGVAISLPQDRLFGAAVAEGALVAVCLGLSNDDSTPESWRRGKPLAAATIPRSLDGRHVHDGLYDCPGKGWRYDPASMASKIADNRILWPMEAGGRPRKKTYQRELKSEFTGFSSVVGFTRNGTGDLADLFAEAQALSFPKPVSLIQKLVEQATDVDSTVMDFFAGSGTTGHAIISSNRSDGGSRKYILVEMGDHFDTLIRPRLKKSYIF